MNEFSPTDYVKRLTVQEAAEILGVGDEAVRKAMREGRLPHEKELHGHNTRYTTTIEAVEAYRANRSGRVVAGYSKEAMQQYRDTVGAYFENLQSAIEENTRVERDRLEVDRQRLEHDEHMTTLLEKLSELMKRNIAANERVADYKERGEEAEAKESQEEEHRSWWARWFGVG